MTQNKLPLTEILTVAIGEIAVAILVIAGYAVGSSFFSVDFSYRVFTGVALGVAVTVLNYMFLVLSVNRAIDSYLSLRGDKEMTDEEAEKFARENSMPIQNAIKTSFIIRTASMLAALLVAFLTSWFAPIATVIPLIAFRPILTVGEMLKRKNIKNPDATKFIKYDNDENEKEDN